MGGVDKGLQAWRGRELAGWVLHTLQPQVSGLGISANRNLDRYRLLLSQCLKQAGQRDLGVHPDDPDLPSFSGPLAGILSGLRRCPTAWMQVASCDTPRLPADLVERLLGAALAIEADIAVPCTQAWTASGAPETRPHWTCALVHKRVTPDLAMAFVKGDRKVGHWIQSQRWVAVSFDTVSDFENMNTLETLEALDGRE